MTDQPLRIRVLTALETEPQTIRQLCVRLDAREGTMRREISDLSRAGAIQHVGWDRGAGWPWKFWGLRA